MMKIGRNMIVAIMITFCFTATLFIVIPIRSATSPYNPWIDYNDDGKISLSDLVSLANSYGTTGDPTKNVNVTNFPSEEEYVFLHYQYGAQSLLETTNDPTVYDTNSTSPVIVKNSTIDVTNYTSTLFNLVLRLNLHLAAPNQPDTMTYSIWYNGMLFFTEAWWGSGGRSFDLPLSTTGPNNILIQYYRTNPDHVYTVTIYGISYEIRYVCSKKDLTSADFGFSMVYLRTLTLSPNDAVILNNDQNQLIENFGTTVVTYEFSEKVILNQIEFFRGTPEITVLAKIQ